MRVPVSLLVAAYVVAGFATFGWNYNTSESYSPPTGKAIENLFAGVFWPMYWGGALAIRWVHP